MRPIEDKVEISIDFPDKFYKGAFEQESRYGAVAEGDGLLMRFERSGDEKRSVSVHLHHNVLAGLLTAWADSLKTSEPMDKRHAAGMKAALKAVENQLG